MIENLLEGLKKYKNHLDLLLAALEQYNEEEDFEKKYSKALVLGACALNAMESAEILKFIDKISYEKSIKKIREIFDLSVNYCVMHDDLLEISLN